MSTADFSRAQWRKSTHSGNTTDCVEVAWHRSSHSGNSGTCVEVARCEHAVGVRDSKHATGPHLVFAEGAWAGFLGRMR
ncbi:DUF397 domain-containing protein [Actinophytocola sp. S1-96]|uniref:DUF397 domain-containing protein n=1 Tax=Actinophytocola gossypii TaxID=2812003 RepID=A0ABT2J580_9PSEU|nr:DUF397 domain-containing protein [Actinophytocola gossypii]